MMGNQMLTNRLSIIISVLVTTGFMTFASASDQAAWSNIKPLSQLDAAAVGGSCPPVYIGKCITWATRSICLPGQDACSNYNDELEICDDMVVTVLENPVHYCVGFGTGTMEGF